MRDEQRKLHDDVRTLKQQYDKLEMRLLSHPNGTGVNSNTNGSVNDHIYYCTDHTHPGYGLPNGCPRCNAAHAHTHTTTTLPSPTVNNLGNLGTHLSIPTVNSSALTTTVGLQPNRQTVNELVDIVEQLQKQNNNGRQFGLPTTGGEVDVGSKAIAKAKSPGILHSANLTLPQSYIYFDLDRYG
jgi:hypothetical protein